MFKDYQKYLKVSLKVYIFVLAIIVILKLIGLDYFGLQTDSKIINTINDFCLNYHLVDVWYCITLYLYAYILISISSNNKKVHKIILLFMPISIIEKILLKDHQIARILVDTIILILINKCAKGDFKRLIKLLLLNFLYQFISLSIRNKNIIIEQDDFIQALIFNFDYILMSLITYNLYFRKGGTTLWEDGEVGLSLQKKTSLKHLHKESHTNWQNRTKQDKIAIIIYVILSFIWNILNIAIVLFVAKLNNTLIECIFILTSFWISKQSFGKPFHLSSMAQCFAVSNLTYYCLNRITTPIGISIIIPVMLGVGLSYVTSKLVKKIYKPLYRGMPLDLFNETILKVVDIDSYKYKICYDYYIEMKSAVSLGLKYHYTDYGIRQICKRINDIIKRLN